jgi:hypothetical protein
MRSSAVPLGLGALLFACASSHAAPSLATSPTRIEAGAAVIRMDARGRLAVLFDRAPADGRADLLVLCAPYEPVPGGWDETLATGELRLDDGRAAFVSSDATLHVELAVDPTRTPVAGSATVRRAGHLRAEGLALAVYEHDLGPVHAVETETIELVAALDPGAVLPAVDCTGGRPDADCLSGRLGSTQATQICGGIASVLGAGQCSVTCGPGFYACGKCGWGGFASCTCRSNFTCDPYRP